MNRDVLAIDLGTTNTGCALWDDARNVPQLLEIDGVTRAISSFDSDSASDLGTIPSAVLFEKDPSWIDRLGAFPSLERFILLGKQARIGVEALHEDARQFQSNFRTGFKRALLLDCEDGSCDDQETRRTTRTFIRELLARVTKTTGRRPREIVFGTPVDCYEAYRGTLQDMARSLGAAARFIDEPIAAALGYGVGIQEPQTLLVIDFGAGTLDLVAVRIDPSSAGQGKATVLAKWGEQLGGNDVDLWLASDICARLGLPDPGKPADALTTWWLRLVVDESRRMKERLFFNETAAFTLAIPASIRQQPGSPSTTDVRLTKPDLIDILCQHDFYQRFEQGLDAMQQRLDHEPLNAVLMVGGSTMLPEVYRRAESRYGRAKLKAWQPFHAVTLGAAVFGANALPTQDRIYHDYAIRVWERDTHKPQHQQIIVRGTQYPTRSDHWSMDFVPTCAHGEPESSFRLIICEIGRRAGGQADVAWDQSGQARLLQHDNDQVIVALNEQDPVLGSLDPPHWPSDRTARLRIQFAIDEDRWLIVTVADLKTQRMILDRHAVLQLR